MLLIVAQCDYSREMLGGFDITTLDHMFMRIGISTFGHGYPVTFILHTGHTK
ncbi:hypothetical protein GCM10011274_44250 [Paraglaciecola chathamensis]|uniref:Uncharacterized protein n=1 Tax=Paraglaciecola chathamensis TaxID=368405 RepID=A0A8H9M5Q9_9ALTE|nr:hypothetical protein GCM10011274_44250 [Paraglaciecola oceanifecundans]